MTKSSRKKLVQTYQQSKQTCPLDKPSPVMSQTDREKVKLSKLFQALSHEQQIAEMLILEPTVTFRWGDPNGDFEKWSYHRKLTDEEIPILKNIINQQYRGQDCTVSVFVLGDLIYQVQFGCVAK